jgi:hypothetical protein
MEEAQHSQLAKIQIDVSAGVSLVCAVLIYRGGFGLLWFIQLQKHGAGFADIIR